MANRGRPRDPVTQNQAQQVFDLAHNQPRVWTTKAFMQRFGITDSQKWQTVLKYARQIAWNKGFALPQPIWEENFTWYTETRVTDPAGDEAALADSSLVGIRSIATQMGRLRKDFQAAAANYSGPGGRTMRKICNQVDNLLAGAVTGLELVSSMMETQLQKVGRR